MPKAVKFGTVLGVAPPGVPAYSSHYKSATAEDGNEPMMSQNGHFTGYKYQCVEYARRWLIYSLGVSFRSIQMAYMIFDLPAFFVAGTNMQIPVRRHLNGKAVASPTERPRLGSVLIWKEGGFFEWTGHVAIVVESSDNWVRVAEQNVTDAIWEKGHFARELPVTCGPNGEYTINETYRHSHVLGWINLPDEMHADLEGGSASSSADDEVIEVKTVPKTHDPATGPAPKPQPGKSEAQTQKEVQKDADEVRSRM